MKSNNKLEQIALYIPAVDTKHYNNEYRTLYPYFVRLTESGEIRGLYYDSEQSFDKLRFYSQWERNADALRTYGWHLEYNDVTVRRPEQALRMLKLLRKVEKIQQNQLVSPTTFGQYVTLLAKGLGIKVALMQRELGQGWERNHFQLKIGEESQQAIDRIIEDSWKLDDAWKLDHPEPKQPEPKREEVNH